MQYIYIYKATFDYVNIELKFTNYSETYIH